MTIEDRKKMALEAINKVTSAWPDEVTVMLTHEQRDTIRELLQPSPMEDVSAGVTPILNSGCVPKNKAPMDTVSSTPSRDVSEVEEAIHSIEIFIENLTLGEAKIKIFKNNIGIITMNDYSKIISQLKTIIQAAQENLRGGK